MADRAALIAKFLADSGWGDAARRKLAGDASFRKYERLEGRQGRAVLMDAPPPMENVRSFGAVARHLKTLGYSAPEILAANEAAGLLLIEDLGDDTFTRLLGAGQGEAALYELAIDLLIDLHRNPRAAKIDLPPYDDDRLLTETALLIDWYLPAIGVPVPVAARDDYLGRWRQAFQVFRAASPTLVLRDYHVDNLIRLTGRQGVAACGLLDFQDAVLGACEYDLVSLLEDARRDVTPSIVAAMIARYRAAFPDFDSATYAVLGGQRNAKIIGIFTRLMARDGKPQYLGHIPRVWRLLEGDLAHPALTGVREWFDRHVPRQRRIVPAIRVPA